MGYYGSMILLLPAIILAMYAQAKVNSAYRRYANISNSTGTSGAVAARQILDANGLSDVPIRMIEGNLTDNYNPRDKVMNLSRGVYQGSSIAAVSIAAHEAGHAIQHSRGYALLNFRNAIVPVVNIGSALSWPLLLAGLIIGRGTGDMLFTIGVLLFLGVVIFHLVTLPVELDASKRALAQLEAGGIVTTEQDQVGARKMLSAAALTYIAALAMAIANLVRILAMRRD